MARPLPTDREHDDRYKSGRSGYGDMGRKMHNATASDADGLPPATRRSRLPSPGGEPGYGHPGPGSPLDRHVRRADPFQAPADRFIPPVRRARRAGGGPSDTRDRRGPSGDAGLAFRAAA